MKMALLFKDLEVSASDRERIENRIRVALTRFTPLIRGLTATISDENGLRGGFDKKCRLVVRLHAGTVVVNEQADAVIEAVTLAAERARGRSLASITGQSTHGRQYPAPTAHRAVGKRSARGSGLRRSVIS